MRPQHFISICCVLSVLVGSIISGTSISTNTKRADGTEVTVTFDRDPFVSLWSGKAMTGKEIAITTSLFHRDHSVLESVKTTAAQIRLRAYFKSIGSMKARKSLI
jgi:hypothetical protein